MTPDTVRGCLLGVAVADALGLPYEGLSPRRAARLLGPPTRHRLLFGRGMVSDDTDHALLVLTALTRAEGDPERFRDALGRGLARWFLGLPAGVGLATLRACCKLLVGVPASRSGVVSAGNGPAMRAPLLGLVASTDDALLPWVEASTAPTHRDPRALHGALAIALAARLAATHDDPSDGSYSKRLRRLLPPDADPLLLDRIEHAERSVTDGASTATYSRELGFESGVGGFVLDSVPVALHAWLAHPTDYRAAVEAVITCGGDADTTAAMTGGIVGARVGAEVLPTDLLDGLLEHPCTVAWMTAQADRLHRTLTGEHDPAPSLPVLRRLPRNLFQLAVVLTHGFRRLFPPY
ncbi:MAG: ADP-ribosylglycohydrolase family protein [Acidobacteriota bacterium]